MNKELYDLCDWAEIEALVYSEHDNPHKLLGAHVTDAGILFHAFIPTAKSIILKLEKTQKEYPMELVDEAGVYGVVIPGKKVVNYTYFVTYDNDTTVEISDPYSFEPVIDAMDMKKFTSGIHYSIYNKMGSHIMEIGGVRGTLFAVWAPSAMRVSVVGNFNLWDGRRHPMRRLGNSGIFELFIPGIEEGQIYKYEIKIGSNMVVLKADPYGNYSELRPATASKVFDINKYQWNDKEWLEKRKKTDSEKEPMLIYEVHLGSWKRPDDGREFYNYREIAPMMADYLKEMGYTHVELMPIMEYPYDASWGYQVTGYYAATSRYGTPDDFMYFMDYMHQNGIGVILDWVPAHFPRDTFGLANFDGTCLYEHLDPRQGYHPHWGTLIYNYGRPEVSNFLIANALFWVDKYHADAIRMDAVASMLYLDYGKNDGEWVANMYGGNENLEAIEMLRKLNEEFAKRKDGSLVIAEESTAWPLVTGDVKKDGLGFNYKWNMGWMNDFTNYMKCDPLFRNGRHGELTFSMIYAYSEKFILVLSHDEVVHGKCSMLNKMPGDLKQKFANLKVAYGFMTAHPGKKLLFMGQEFAQLTEWSEDKGLDWGLLEREEHLQMKEYVKALNRLYKDYPALYALDYNSDGFEWINNMDAERSIVSFLRKTENNEEDLLVVCNFTPVVYEDYKIGVPFKGKYKETFNSDKEIFGGSGNVNPRMKQSKEEEMDNRLDSISITVPPLGIVVFTCTPAGDVKKGTKTSKTTKTAVKKLIKKETKATAKSNSRGIKETTAEVKEAAPKSTTTPAAPLKTPKKVTTTKAEPKKVATTKEEPKKVATTKEEPKKVATKKEEPKKVATTKEEPKKVSTTKEEPKKVATTMVEPKKVATTKEEPKKVATTKEEPKKVATTKEEPKKVATTKVEQKKVATTKEEPKKVATTKVEQKKVATTKLEPKKVATAKVETETVTEVKEEQMSIFETGSPESKAVETKNIVTEPKNIVTEPQEALQEAVLTAADVETEANKTGKKGKARKMPGQRKNSKK